ncbi:MAG: pyrroline-5-carboxylate reductase [Clostridiales Family XIII bacterium]|jgi:pyrroline-5-carboxylate reductase|nr:pyrroline-5-carboxylate reductase [Clostridiales Family XIII bacterium]
MRLGFIGAGNMGGAIIRGYIAATPGGAAAVSAYDKNGEKLAEIAGSLGIRAAGGVAELAAASDIVMLAVKPTNFEDVLPELAPALRQGHTVVSMAAGISIAYIEGFLGADRKIVRIMPNTPAMVGESMTAVSRNANLGDDEFEGVMAVFSTIGRAAEVDESLMDTVVGVSGSSPAYAYMFIDALAKGAAGRGMDEAAARTFAAQATLGAAKMVLETGVDPVVLCQNVCSPGGATIEAVEVLRRRGFEGIVAEALEAAAEKSKRLAK